MATGGEVLKLLVPQGGYVIYGDDYDSIRWDEGVSPITKDEFNDGFARVDAAKAQAEAEAQAKRFAALAKLEALGLDEDDLKALGF